MRMILPLLVAYHLQHISEPLLSTPFHVFAGAPTPAAMMHSLEVVGIDDPLESPPPSMGYKKAICNFS